MLKEYLPVAIGLLLIISKCFAAVDTTNCDKITADTTQQTKRYDISSLTTKDGECISHITSANADDKITVQVQYIWNSKVCLEKDTFLLSNIGSKGQDREISTCRGIGTNFPLSFLTKDGKVTFSLKMKSTETFIRGIILSFQTVCGKTIELETGSTQVQLSPDFPNTYKDEECAPVTFKAKNSSEHVFVLIKKAQIGKSDNIFECPKFSYQFSEMDYNQISNGGTVKLCGFIENMEMMSKDRSVTVTINTDDTEKQEKKFVLAFKTVPKFVAPNVRTIDYVFGVRTRTMPMVCMNSGTSYPVTVNIYTMRTWLNRFIRSIGGLCTSYFSLGSGSYITFVVYDLNLKESQDCEEESLSFSTLQFGTMKPYKKYCKSAPVKAFYIKSSYIGLDLNFNALAKKKIPTFYVAKVCDVVTALPSDVKYEYFTANYPDPIPNGFLCFTEYYPANFMKEKVEITIEEMEFEKSTDCVNDFLEIYYTYKDPETKKDVKVEKGGRQCGKIAKQVISDWGKVTIIVRTNGFTNSKGGKMSFKAKSSSSIKPELIVLKVALVAFLLKIFQF